LEASRGQACALVPLIWDLASKSAQFTVSRLSQDKNGSESIEEMELIDVDEKPATTSSEPKLQLKIIAIDPPIGRASKLSSSMAELWTPSQRDKSRRIPISVDDAKV
jgi:hypothetical protein